MDIVLGVFALMGGSILILLKVNKDLRSKNKLKDIEIGDVKLEAEQKAIRKEKNKLKESLDNIQIDTPDLNDSQIEDFWKGKKRK